VDGSPDQFVFGQTSSATGVSRTTFGIPATCASDYSNCGVLGLIHYTWAFQPRGAGGSIGVLHPGGPNLSYWEIDVPGFNHCFLYCHSATFPFVYFGPVVDVATTVATELHYLIGWSDDGTTMYFARDHLADPSAWEVAMHFLPGP
jgi:hypothetical protein